MNIIACLVYVVRAQKEECKNDGSSEDPTVVDTKLSISSHCIGWAKDGA